MIIMIVIILAVSLIMCSLIPTKGEDQEAIKFFVIVCFLISFACGVYILSYDSGIKDGAYNQLKGKYEITYVINKDSCVIDTVINLN